MDICKRYCIFLVYDRVSLLYNLNCLWKCSGEITGQNWPKNGLVRVSINAGPAPVPSALAAATPTIANIPEPIIALIPNIINSLSNEDHFYYQNVLKDEYYSREHVLQSYWYFTSDNKIISNNKIERN